MAWACSSFEDVSRSVVVLELSFPLPPLSTEEVEEFLLSNSGRCSSVIVPLLVGRDM